MILNNQQITEEIKKEIKICIETNENENTTTQNLWDSVKAVLRVRFIAIQAYLQKQEKNKINYLTLHLKQLEKEEVKNRSVNRRKKIIKIKAEMEKVMAPHPSTLAWKLPWMEEPGRLQSMGSLRVGHD